MMTPTRVTSVALLLACLGGVCFVATGAGAAEESPDSTVLAAVRALADQGFENVSVGRTADGGLDVRYENRIERWDLPAIGRVAEACRVAVDGEHLLAVTPLVRAFPSAPSRPQPMTGGGFSQGSPRPRPSASAWQ
jgi:hypothetical protein